LSVEEEKTMKNPMATRRMQDLSKYGFLKFCLVIIALLIIGTMDFNDKVGCNMEKDKWTDKQFKLCKRVK
jgi:hypothetical protein